jgi:hypothetical protein
MIVRFSMSHLTACALVSLGLATGCGKTEPTKTDMSVPAKEAATHDHGDGSGAHSHEANPHDVPITEEQKAEMRKQGAKYPDAVAMIKEFRGVTEAETKNGIPQNPFKAHQALDKADLVLQWLPGIARDSNVPKDQWETINTTSQQLRGLFEKVHQRIDDKKDPDFASVAKDVDAAIARLEAAAEAKAKP